MHLYTVTLFLFKCSSFSSMNSKEFLGGLVVKGSGIVTVMAWVTAVAWIQSPAWELLHAMGMAKKKKKTKTKNEKMDVGQETF